MAAGDARQASTSDARQASAPDAGRATKEPRPGTRSGWAPYLDAVRRIPPGRVATYGTVAALAGRPRAARQAGYALASLRGDAAGVPWHRVVGRRARAGVGISLRGPAAELQRTLLADEGVPVRDDGAIDARYEWPD